MTKETLKRIIGDNIRRERTTRNMTVDELAELLELTPGFVGLIERGRRGATIHNLYKLAEIFGVDIDKFTTDQHTPTFTVAERNSAKTKRTKITSLICQMNDNELEFVISMIKSMKVLRADKMGSKQNSDKQDAVEYGESPEHNGDNLVSYDNTPKKRKERANKNDSDKKE